jgi:hypothetical protein
MTTAEKISFLKENLAPPHTLANLRRDVNMNGKFDPRPVFSNKAVNATFPSRDADDEGYSDGTADGIPADDDDSTAAHVKRAQNHLEMCDEDMCRAAPTDGPDHLTLAHKHIGEALEMRARAGRLAAVGQNVVSVRFA